MTTQPTYPMPPGAPLYYEPPRRSPRPTAVTVLAILGIVIGSFGVLCKPPGLLPLFVDLSAMMPGGVKNPMLDAQRNDPLLFAWTLGSILVGTAISVLLLSGSIGSLYLRPWARKAMVAYTVAAVAMTVINAVVTLVWLLPKITAAQQQMIQQMARPGTPGPPPQMMSFMKAGGIGGAVMGALLGLAFPAFIAYFFTRSEVKDAFARGMNVRPPEGGGTRYAGYAPPPGAPPAP
jgi:hypothetical protein